MAERDPRRLGVGVAGPGEVARVEGEPAPEEPGSDAATAERTEAPPRDRRAGLSWSNLAELDDEDAGPAGEGFHVGPFDGTGGLLGVDSGLLRVIEAAPQPRVVLKSAAVAEPEVYDEEGPTGAPGPPHFDAPLAAAEVEVSQSSAWGSAEELPEAAWGPASPESIRSLVPMARPDPLRELDPFAAPVGVGLADEIGGDPFDSLSLETSNFRLGERVDAPLKSGGSEAATLEFPAARAADEEPTHPARSAQKKRGASIDPSAEGPATVELPIAQDPSPIGRPSVLSRIGEEPIEFDEPPTPPLFGAPLPPPARATAPAESAPPLAVPPAEPASAWAPPEPRHSTLAPAPASPAPDPLTLLRLGSPFLGSIPRLEAIPTPAEFPPGSLALRAPRPLSGPAVIPDLGLPDPFDLDDLGHRLLAALQAEILACDERRALAALLHAYGRVAADVVRLPGLAAEAFAGALENDPDYALNRWRVLEERAAADSPDDWVAALTRLGSADSLNRAGHVAWLLKNDVPQALALWERAATASPPSLCATLAAYGVSSGAALREQLIAQAEGAVLASLLRLDEINGGDWSDRALDRKRSDVREIQRRWPASSAVQATIERTFVQLGDPECLLNGLRDQLERVTREHQQGERSDAESKAAAGELFFKAAWVLERLSRPTEALQELSNAAQSLPNDPALQHLTGALARRTGRVEELRAHLERMAAQAAEPVDAANSLFQLGLVAQDLQGDEARAGRDFERALAAHPTFTPALAALGRSAMRDGRFGEVRQRFEGEIAKLEEVLERDLELVVRERTIRGLLLRYYRVAALLEQKLADPETALVYYKRALALSPGFVPAFLGIERAYEQSGRWRELVALYRGLIERAGEDSLETNAALLRVAELLHTRLGDHRNAARAYARVLANAPDDRGVLARASEVFGRLDHRAAIVEVELRRASTAPDARTKVHHLVRAGATQLLEGEPVAAAADALSIFREALELDPTHPGAMDGMLRSANVLGRAVEVGALVQRIADEPKLDPAILAQATDALLADGRLPDALRALAAWRRVQPDAEAARAILVPALERSRAWPALVKALEDLADHTAHPRRRASILARMGEIIELRLGDRGLARGAYQRALQLDAGCQAARDGRSRVDPVTRAATSQVAPRELLSGLRAVLASGLEPTAARLDVTVLAGDGLDARTTAAAARILARGDERGVAVEVLRLAFEAAPHRLDAFEAFVERLESPAQDQARVDALWRRVPFETVGGRAGMLASILAHSERLLDEAGVRRAAADLVALDPTSLVAALAVRRQALRGGQAMAAFEAGERVAGLLQSPKLSARMYRTLAQEAVDLPVGAARARTLLEQALTLDPNDHQAATALEHRLREEQDWTELLALYQRRIAAQPDAGALRTLTLRKARLLGGPLGRKDEALKTLHQLVEQSGDDPVVTLDAALCARDLGSRGLALTWLEPVIARGDRETATEAGVVRARLLREAGDAKAARETLEHVVAVEPTSVPALELLAEFLALERDWPQAVRTIRRLFDLEPDPARKGEHAMAIGEILSRVKGDARAAAGWFKRAIDHAPQHLTAVWRMLEEADRVPAGDLPAEQVADALDRAVAEVSRRLADDPFHVENLRGLADLQVRRRAPEVAAVARAALELLGEATPTERAFLSARRAERSTRSLVPMSAEARRTHLLHPDEQGVEGRIFSLLAPALSELLSERPPAGAVRLPVNAFLDWQAEFSRVLLSLGTAGAERWQVPGTPQRLSGAYLPTPAIFIGVDVLSAPVDARMVFRLADLLEGLRDGRLLLEREGVERVSAVLNLLLSSIAPDLVERRPGNAPLALELVARVDAQADAIPADVSSSLRACLQATPGAPIDLARLAAAVEATRARAGYIACRDLGAALEGTRSTAGGRLDTRNLRTLEPARALLSFALSPAAMALSSESSREGLK